MKEHKTRFICQECGAIYPKAQGRCYHCEGWNTVVEEVLSENPTGGLNVLLNESIAPMPLTDVEYVENERILTGIAEFDRVTGGGIVPGSLVLIGGSPGIGKSTLLLSAADNVAEKSSGRVIYVTGEESATQIKMRADRIGAGSKKLLILPEIDMGKILAALAQEQFSLVIIDSIQTMLHPGITSAPGSISQIRECTGLLQRFCKTSGTPVILVGHITRAGSIAGPMVLEHIVDAVLYFEGENIKDYRILRAFKNRFGSTQEIGVFIMRSDGLSGVGNPSEFFLSGHSSEISGSVVAPVIEGSRTLLIEIQALISSSGFGIPARRAEGVSANRVALLLAVLEKRCKLQLASSDVFINVVGGVEVDEPASDLAIILAVASGLRDKPLPAGTCVVGEVGLGGEVRGVSRIEERIRESARMGFGRIIMPAENIDGNISTKDVALIGVRNVREALVKAF